MFKITQNIKNRTKHNEQGFTLIELMIVLVIIGILASVALLVFGKQQRAAMEGRIQHDTASNRPIMVTPTDGLYTTPKKFFQAAAQSENNTVAYIVSKNHQKACTQTSYTFGENDTVVWRFMTEVGKIEPLSCFLTPTETYGPDYQVGYQKPGEEPIYDTLPPTTEPPTNAGGTPTTPPAGETGGGTTVNPPVTNEPGGGNYNPFTPGNAHTKITATVSSNEKYRVCYKVIAEGEANTLSEWKIIVDRTIPPFKDNTETEGPNDSRYNVVRTANQFIITGTGDMAKVSSNKSQNFEFCSKASGNSPIILIPTTSEIERVDKVTGDQYDATQNIFVTNNSQFYANTVFEVDITELKNTAHQKSGNEPRVDGEGNKIVKVSDNIYRITSSHSHYSVIKGNATEFVIRLS